MHRFITRALVALVALAALVAGSAAYAVPAPITPYVPPAGIFDLSLCPGVVYDNGQPAGAQQTQAIQTSNATNINACLATAVTNNLLPQLPPKRLEVYGTVFNPDGAKGLKGWQGAISSIVQYSPDAQALKIGDTTFTTGSYQYYGDVTLGMGVQGTTNSRCVLQGSLFYSMFERVNCSRYASGAGPYHPNIGWEVMAGGNAFQNTYLRDNIAAGQVSYFRDVANDSGSNFIDIYWADGSPTDLTTLSGSVVYFANNHDMSIIRGNIEHVNASTALEVDNENAFSATALHFEDVQAKNAYSPQIFNFGTCYSCTLTGVQVYDWSANGTIGTSGTPNLIHYYGQNNVLINGLSVYQTSVGSLTLAWRLFDYDTSTVPVSPSTLTVNNLTLKGTAIAGTLSLDASLPAATFGNVAGFGSYTWDRGVSTTENALINVTDANFTLYGVHHNAMVNYTGAVSAARTATIAKTMVPSGIMANILRRTDDRPYFYRDGTATGAFSVQPTRWDGTAVGSALTAASTGTQIDPQLIADPNNNNTSTLTDASQTVYAQGPGNLIMTDTAARTITISPQLSASITTAAPQGSCLTIANANGSAAALTVAATGMTSVALAANTSGKFCSSNGSGTFARYQ